MSTLPEMHLLPTDLQSIIELVKKHDGGIAKKLDDSYHLASFNVTFSSAPVCFINKELTHEEATKVQEWLHHEETRGNTSDKVRHFGHLLEVWRPISREHL